MSTLEVEFAPADNDRLSNLCGPLDENLRQIEVALEVEIARRSEKFKVTGARARDAITLLERFYAVSGEPVEPGAIQLGIIELGQDTQAPVDAGALTLVTLFTP